MKIDARKLGMLILGFSLALGGCGGGSGLGPKELKKQEDKVRDQLPSNWDSYEQNDFQGAIDVFTETLEQADLLEDQPGVQNQVKSEAFNGIGWSFFQMQDLDGAWDSFRQATNLDRENTDAWVGWAGVALVQRRYGDVIQFSIQALETDVEYSSAFRSDVGERQLGHDRFDVRHVRLMLAEAYFQLGRYSASDRPDPNNAAAQIRLIKGQFKYRDPGQLLLGISQVALELQEESSSRL